MSTPVWAIELTTVVCAEAGVLSPRLAWRRSSREHSSGVTRRDRDLVSVRAGTDPLDQRLTLLHELAHWLVPAPRRSRRIRARHHGRSFYLVAFALYRRHGIADGDALRLEAGRYPSALHHATAIGVPGGLAALAEHRRHLRARPRRRWTVLVAEHAVRLGRDGRWHVCVTCGQRVVGSNLARIRRADRPVRHVLMTARS